MTTFDPADYETRVVRPLRGLAQLPDDLITRYAIDLSMRDDEVADRVRHIRAYWAEKARLDTNVGMVYKAFIRAHRELEATHGDRLKTIRWWHQWDEQRSATRRSKIDDPVAGDLPELAAGLARLPLAAVLDLIVQPDASGVRLGWRASPSYGESMEYRVVRKIGRSPAGPADGEVITTTSRLAMDDRTPPVGCLVFYAVFAGQGTGVWSLPAVAEIQVIPPVSDVRAAGERDAITVQWRAHPEVVAVHVQRKIGSAVQTPSKPLDVVNSSVRDTDVRDGVEYVYSIVAVYRCAGRDGEVAAAPVMVRAATRPDLAAVTEVRVELVDTVADLRVQVTWQQPIGAQVVIRQGAASPPWAAGERVSAAEIASYGQELTGAPTLRDGWMTLIAPVEAGRSIYVPFTVDQHGGIRGQEATFALVMPVHRLRGERFGSELLLSWVWPKGVSVAEVAWSDSERRITRQQYRDQGGCRISLGGQAATIEVTAIMLGDREATCSTPAVLQIGAELPRLSYTLERRRLWLTGRVRCIVRFASSELIRCTVLVVVAEGHNMPLNATAGQVVSRQDEIVVPGGAETSLELILPPLRRPYWVRCFVADDDEVLLVDPPLSHLKVS